MRGQQQQFQEATCWMWNFVNRVTGVKPKWDFFDHFYISLRHGYAFHTVGKAANSTVKYLMYERELAGTRYKMPSVHDRMSSPLLSPFQLSDAEMDRVIHGDAVFRFTFVRNPYSRLLSCYLDRIVPGKSRPYRELIRRMKKDDGYQPGFAEFIITICEQDVHEQNNHWRVQYDDAMCELVDYHYIGKQERFETDFSEIHTRIFGHPPKAEPTRVNASPSETSAASRLDEFWTPELRTLVAEKYARDFEFFQYDTEQAG